MSMILHQVAESPRKEEAEERSRQEIQEAGERLRQEIRQEFEERIQVLQSEFRSALERDRTLSAEINLESADFEII
jgi:DNA-binding PadR family transcriptional regulator